MAGEAEWYLAENGKQVGPMSMDELAARVSALGEKTPVYGPGLDQWTPAKQVPSLATAMRTSHAPASAPSRVAPPQAPRAATAAAPRAAAAASPRPGHSAAD